MATVVVMVIRHERMKEDQNNNEEIRMTVIDRSNILETIDPSLLPDPLSPISTDIERNELYQSLRDEIEIMKLPSECQGETQLYECEGSYFRNLTRYHDDWSGRTGTKWHVPDIPTTFSGKEDQFENWRYDIINYPVIPNFLTSQKSRV